MTPTFSQTLQEQNAATWARAVEHRFVHELFDGSVPDEVMAGYLIQDHRFLDSFLKLLGSAVATADTFAARLTLGEFTGAVAGDENTYFLRAFDALGVSEQHRADEPDTAATTGFIQLFQDAADARSYPAALGVLVVTEWLYLDWASRASTPAPESFVHAEWISIHDNPEFREFSAFLRAELDRVGPDDADVAAEFFGRAVELEEAFFDDAYAHPFRPGGNG